MFMGFKEPWLSVIFTRDFLEIVWSEFGSRWSSSDIMNCFWLWKLYASSSNLIYTNPEGAGAGADSQTNQMVTQLSVVDVRPGLLKSY